MNSIKDIITELTMAGFTCQTDSRSRILVYAHVIKDLPQLVSIISTTLGGSFSVQAELLDRHEDTPKIWGKKLRKSPQAILKLVKEYSLLKRQTQLDYEEALHNYDEIQKELDHFRKKQVDLVKENASSILDAMIFNVASPPIMKELEELEWMRRHSLEKIPAAKQWLEEKEEIRNIDYKEADNG